MIHITVISDKFKDTMAVCGDLLNHMIDSLFDFFIVQKYAKVIWNTLESKYGGDDAGKKRYVVGKWLQFQIFNNKSMMKHVHEYKNMVAKILSEVMKTCEIF